MKIYFIVIFFLISLNANSLLQEKIENILGKKEYQINKLLILNKFNKEENFYKNNKIDYIRLFEVLKNNGLLKLRYTKPEKTSIIFEVSKKDINLIKIIKDTLTSMGYLYYFIDYIIKDDNNIVWKINFKSASMLDPLIFFKELKKLDIDVVDVNKLDNYLWRYNIDLTNAILANTIIATKDEVLRLKKPHKAYILQIDEGEILDIISKRLNSWYPRVIFYDNKLNLLDIIKTNKVHKELSISIPQDTKYIVIDDIYTLLNIKRGLTVLVR